MVITSAQAAKLLKKLNEEYESILSKEEKSKTFLVSIGEDVESLRPKYDYSLTQSKLEEMESKIRKLKHRINIFNTTQKLNGFNMTIDEMLVYIPQLTKKKEKLSQMKNLMPKQRRENFGSHSNIIDYCYANYDIEKAEKDYAIISQELANAQNALDIINNTETFEFDF